MSNAGEYVGKYTCEYVFGARIYTRANKLFLGNHFLLMSKQEQI
jgi:hypothetical protein